MLDRALESGRNLHETAPGGLDASCLDHRYQRLLILPGVLRNDFAHLALKAENYANARSHLGGAPRDASVLRFSLGILAK